jgi:hypothetical protein
MGSWRNMMSPQQPQMPQPFGANPMQQQGMANPQQMMGGRQDWDKIVAPTRMGQLFQSFLPSIGQRPGETNTYLRSAMENLIMNKLQKNNNKEK